MTVLALDFDGVLCDATLECACVTWNGWHERPIEAFDQPVPVGFAERFVALRGYATRLEHFVVTLKSARPIGSQAAFDAAFARRPVAEVAAFAARVTRYRDRVRAQRHDAWIQAHALYPGMVELLAREQPYIVTARDAGSVGDILAAAGVTIAPERIFGGLAAKVEALEEIARTEGVDHAALLFVDDAAVNVAAAQTAGFGARWADWGHGQRRLGVTPIGRDDLYRISDR